MNQQFQIQKLQLEQALHYANVIEDCDEKIEKIVFTNIVNYYKDIRTVAICKYIDVVSKIVESSIEMGEKSISDNLSDTFTTITKQYAIQNGINLK